jgi:hypothetical protein
VRSRGAGHVDRCGARIVGGAAAHVCAVAVVAVAIVAAAVFAAVVHVAGFVVVRVVGVVGGVVADAGAIQFAGFASGR